MSFATLAGSGAAQLMCSSVSVHVHGHSTESDDVAEVPKPKAIEWNIGTMMRMMKLDPKLLGWNDETEDWEDV